MKLDHLPSVNLVWHNLKLQHSSSDIVGIEELFRLNVVYYSALFLHTGQHRHTG